MPVEVICPICGVKTKRKPSHANHVSCSNKCGQELRSKNAFEKHKKLKDVYYELYWVENKSFREISNIVRYSVRTLRKAFFDLGIPIRKGSEAIHGQWNGNTKRKQSQSEWMKKWNLSIGNDGTRTERYKKNVITHRHREWSAIVRFRDNYTCKNCGKISKRNAAHHIKSALDYPKLALDPDNGITLCSICHGKVHTNKLSLNSIDSSRS